MLLKGNEKLMSITKPNDKLLHDATGTILENWDKKYGIYIRGSVDTWFNAHKFNAELNNDLWTIETNILT